MPHLILNQTKIMIKSICLASSIILMSGCLYDDDDATTTAASQTAVVAKAPPSVGSSGLVGKTITFNPIITFVSDNNLSYINDKDGDYPVVQGTVYGKIEIDSSDPDPDKLSLIININGDVIVLSFGFRDLGGEGYIDEAVLDEVKVNDEVKVLPAKVTVAIEAGTVRNENVTAESSPDLTGAPSVDEWNKYLLGTGLLVTNNDGEISVVEFSSSSEATIYHINGSDAGTSESFSYIYTKLDENTGTLDMTDYYIYDYAGDPWHGQNIKDEGQVKLIWSSDEDATFYNGQWSDVQGSGVYTNLDTGEERVSTSSVSSGTFGVVSNVSIYIEQSKQTASTGN